MCLYAHVDMPPAGCLQEPWSVFELRRFKYKCAGSQLEEVYKCFSGEEHKLPKVCAVLSGVSLIWDRLYVCFPGTHRLHVCR